MKEAGKESSVVLPKSSTHQATSPLFTKTQASCGREVGQQFLPWVWMLGDCWRKVTVMEMFAFYAVQNGSYYSHVTTEHLTCD